MIIDQNYLLIFFVQVKSIKSIHRWQSTILSKQLKYFNQYNVRFVGSEVIEESLILTTALRLGTAVSEASPRVAMRTYLTISR